MSQAELDACVSRREKDRNDFRQSLEDVKRTGTTSLAERAREVQRFTNQIRACQDDAFAARHASAEAIADARQKAAVATEREESQSLLQSQKAEIESLTAQRDTATSERAACRSDLDACRVAIRRVPAPVSAPVDGTLPRAWPDPH
jgi:chromosome segregation ATPase